MKRLLFAVAFLSGALLLAQQAIRVKDGGTGTTTIGTSSGLCSSSDGLKVVTCAATVTNTPTFTGTATVTNTPTLTPTPTNTPTATVTPTASNTPTDTPTDTPTNTPTITGTRTDTPTPTSTPTATFTPVVATGTWFGSAVSFQKNVGTGATAYMTVPDAAALDATSGISISIWVKYRGYSTSAAGQGIFVKGTATGASSSGQLRRLWPEHLYGRRVEQ